MIGQMNEYFKSRGTKAIANRGNHQTLSPHILRFRVETAPYFFNVCHNENEKITAFPPSKFFTP